MLLLVEFDVSADIIDVPQSVIDDRERLSRRFLKWLHDPGVKHKYWTTFSGHRGLCYRSDALVEWLNKTVLKDSDQKAAIIEQYVSVNNEQHLPSVFF